MSESVVVQETERLAEGFTLIEHARKQRELGSIECIGDIVELDARHPKRYLEAWKYLRREKKRLDLIVGAQGVADDKAEVLA